MLLDITQNQYHYRLDLLNIHNDSIEFSKEIATDYNRLNMFCRKHLKLSVESACCNYTTPFDSHYNGKNLNM